MNILPKTFLLSSLFGFHCFVSALVACADQPSIADYPSIQASLDANPGKAVFVPAGDHSIKEKIRIRHDRSGLFGPGRIIQQNAQHPIIEIEQASQVTLRDITLTRSEGSEDTLFEGVLAIRAQELVVNNVSVIDNRTRSAAIVVRDSVGARIQGCLIKNYMRVSIDDRSSDLNWGYAFLCTDGTGISLNASTGSLIENNRIVEGILRPTQELRDRHKLGTWVKKNPEKGKLLNQKTWDAGYTDNWQQGSAIVVTSPEKSDSTRILGNHIENAAQGIDLHCDHAIVSNNVVLNSFIGMKAMHGSRNILIANNQFIKNSLWAIGLMPGVASHTANIDGGSIISGNLVSDFGEGDAAWVWGKERSPFKFDHGQDADDPPLTDVLIVGNLLHCQGTPKYRYAVVIEGEPNAPRGLHFSNNLFTQGTDGLANLPLSP